MTQEILTLDPTGRVDFAVDNETDVFCLVVVDDAGAALDPSDDAAAAANRGHLIELAQGSETTENFRFVVGPLSPDEGEAWITRLEWALDVPSGRIAVTGGRGLAQGGDAPGDGQTVVVEVPPGRYVVRFFSTVPDFDAIDAIEAALPEDQTLPEYFAQTRPGEPLPSWAALYAQDSYPEVAEALADIMPAMSYEELEDDEGNFVHDIVQLEPIAALPDDLSWPAEADELVTVRLPDVCPIGILVDSRPEMMAVHPGSARPCGDDEPDGDAVPAGVRSYGDAPADRGHRRRARHDRAGGGDGAEYVREQPDVRGHGGPGPGAVRPGRDQADDGRTRRCAAVPRRGDHRRRGDRARLGARRRGCAGGQLVGLFVDSQIKRNVDRLPLPFNRYGIDPLGISKKHIVGFYSPFAQIYRHYLKVTTFGMENVPAQGSALLIGNHSGGIGADAAMTMTSLLLNDDHPRLAHGMAEYLFNRFPFTSELMSRVGHLTGLPRHAELLLGSGRIVVVFPEGARGALKLYRDRYKLVRFGTGFMRLALRARVPVIPFAFVGGEETFPTMFGIKSIGKLVGAPHMPIAPQLVFFPLPVSCQIHFGEPMFFEGDGGEPDEIVRDYVDQVKDRIHGLIEGGLALRPTAFTTERIDSPYDPTRQ